MSTIAMGSALEDFLHAIRQSATSSDICVEKPRKHRPTARLALLYSEQFRFPRSSRWQVHILSGKAWISFDRKDFLLKSGDCLSVPKIKNGAIISALGNEALFFEIT